jgi:hypothetical protein
MDGGISELPRNRYGGNTRNFLEYGRLKDLARAWKLVTNGQLIALPGIISRRCGKRRPWIY